MRTLPRALAAAAARHPDREFVVADDGRATYAAAAEASAGLADAFTALGLDPGDRVGILLPNGLRWCTVLLAAHAAGAGVVPLNTWLRAGELRDVVRRSRLRLLVAQREIFGHDVEAALADALAQAAPDFLGIHFWEPGSSSPEGLAASPDPDGIERLARIPVDPVAEGLLLFTSGSTAAPKAVRLQQVGMAEQGHAIGRRQGVRDGDRFWLAVPLFFVFGCANALPNAITHAATLCLQDRFDPVSALAFIERERCTVYYAVGPMTRALAASPALADHDISTLRTGTANATPEDLRLAIDVLGVEHVCNAYGLTEGYGHSTITSWDDPPQVRMTTQGRPLPTQEVRVAAGEIQIRGTITPGYLDPDLTSRMLTADGWFRTGDLGFFDADGRLHFTGRSHEMMKIKGVNVSPAEVEALLVGHADVDEAFVFGVPTPDGDEAVACALVTTLPAPAHAALAAEVREWARVRAAAYKVPTQVVIMARGDLPLTATGKVSKLLLSERLRAYDTAVPR